MSSRTEKATPRRREEAYKKGKFPRGPKLPMAAGFVTAVAVLNVTAGDFVYHSRHLFSSLASQAVTSFGTNKPISALTVQNLLVDASWSLALLTLPVIIAMLVAGLVGNFLQGGLTIIPDLLLPTADKFNPLEKIKRIFSAQNTVEFLKNLFELSLIAATCYGVLRDTVLNAPAFVGSPVPNTLVALGAVAYKMCLRIGAVMAAFALVDYGYKWYVNEKSLRMTKQEVKDEFRQQEGDPAIKGQRRRKARELVQRRNIIVEVPKADVVVTNPTHFAVALRYDREKHQAPMVVAKGADLMAKRIRDIAGAHGVAVIENPPLARALYKAVEPGQTIPPEFFRAVAELLAYVYRQRQTRAS